MSSYDSFDALTDPAGDPPREDTSEQAIVDLETERLWRLLRHLRDAGGGS